jgi:preprotein translocase subunit SecE
MKKLFRQLKEVRDEFLRKVTWPSWDELIESSILVAVASVIIAIVILVMDLASQGLVGLVY